ncbi:hypothetical protein D9M69_529340 [compost metagenome]
MLSWISARLGQVQTSPWLNANSTRPSTHLSRKASSLSMMSAKNTLGDLPPSSSVAGIRLLAAACAITRPVVVEPVKAILAMRLLCASGMPASRPKPFTMLSTPGGSRSAISSARIRIEIGVDSAGLSTTQLPAASAGASFQAAIRIGKFQGMIWPTTPSGSWM